MCFSFVVSFNFYYSYYSLLYVSSMVAQRAALPHLKASGFRSKLKLLPVLSLSYPTCVYLGSLWILQFSSTVQTLAFRPKLLLKVKGYVNVCTNK